MLRIVVKMRKLKEYLEALDFCKCIDYYYKVC